ncbi:hypothetical protein A3K86_16675 [Photobacterium jeanii]|uniref:DUF3857 domain-containing protein n=1 Tax=Photobacterium jeanii TaxID=858640 RepID=A0A178K7G5_9GAMM|nr:DUF3857 domain-containing protein [Photobacterium jeanii]OAN13288.1 hypothetical protein A3K86_16675 [Photobacterium jeanii]PST90287.1 DUF3857 domain-containing protein [Photobacterium jeanii]
MKMTGFIPFFVFSVFICGNVFANEEIKWKVSESGDLFNRAREFQRQIEKPEEVTQILQSKNVSVVGDNITEHVKEIWFYPSSRDIGNHADHSIYFNDRVERLTIISASSIDKQGSIKSIEASSLQILDTDNYRSFTDDKEVVLTIPGLSEGSLAVIEYEISSDRLKLQGDWSQIFYTQGRYPIANLDINVSWQLDEPLYWSSNSNNVECNQTESQLYCTGQDIAAFKNDKAIFWRDYIGQVAIGESKEWQQVVSIINDEVNSALSDTTGLEALLEQIIGDNKNIEDQIKLIHEFVARDIRYVSMSELGHTITPHDIASIIKNRYGDCKDKSALLHALLERIGIESYPVLIATDRTRADQLIIPTFRYFDHIVMCFDYLGKQYCLDATDQDTFWKFTPSWIQNKVSLVLKSNQQPSQILNNKYRWKMHVSTSVEFDLLGGQEEHQKRTYYGEYASSYRRLLLQKSPSERDEWLTQQYHNEVSTYADPQFNIVKLANMAPELVIKSEAKLSPFLDVKSDLIYEENDAWLKDELELLRLDNKHYEEHFPGLKIQSEYVYDLSEIWKIQKVSPTLRFDHKFGSMHREIHVTDDGKLKIATFLLIPQQLIKASEIQSFNHFLDVMRRESLIQFKGKLAESSA